MKYLPRSAITILAVIFLFFSTTTVDTEAQVPRNLTAASDVKIRQKMTPGGSDRSVESTMYVKGVRMRSEMNTPGMSVVTVRQCDLKRTLMINDQNKTYMIIPDGGGGEPAQVTAAAGRPPTAKRQGGVVNLTSMLNDTGERKQMFGFAARHIKSSTLKEASPDACDTANTKIETDGWYIDFQFDFQCPDEPKTMASGVSTRPDCQDEIRTRSIGKAQLGFPVFTTTTVYGPDGLVQTTVTNEVVELSRETLAAALFDVPEGYRLVTNHQELYGTARGVSQPGVDQADKAPSKSDIVSNSRDPAISSAVNLPAGFVSASSPKQPGVTRIGIMLPKAQMTGENGPQAAEALRYTFASFLKGPNVELVALNSMLYSQAVEEAKQAQCDFVLSSSLTQKKGGGGMFGKALGNVASSAVGHLPGGRTAGEAVARSVVVSGTYSAADVSRSIKSKDELSLEYRLESTNGTKPGVSKTEKAKAKSDGEDILTPLVEKASEAIFAAIR